MFLGWSQSILFYYFIQGSRSLRLTAELSPESTQYLCVTSVASHQPSRNFRMKAEHFVIFDLGSFLHLCN